MPFSRFRGSFPLLEDEGNTRVQRTTKRGWFPGGQLNVNWTTSIAYPWDSICLDRVGAAVGIHAWAQSTAGAASGTFTLSAPTQAGQYEFRYLLEDESAAGRSSPVEVGTGPSPTTTNFAKTNPHE